MTATLPSEILQSWSSWRPTRNTLLTPPPPTANMARRGTEPALRVPTSLPSIAHFDRQLPPLEPPFLQDANDSHSRPSSSRLPPLHDMYPEPASTAPEFQLGAEDMEDALPTIGLSSPTPRANAFAANTDPAIDWLDFSRKRSAQHVAEKTCEMVCYLWFASPASSPHQAHARSGSERPLLTRRTSSLTPLQLAASPTFVQFMQKLLETTQVSQSVIVLSLHYIYRLKEANCTTPPAQAGSEFRIAVAGLMMANKFLDDNTYTNKTWSEVTGIALDDINKMEREFLLGINFGLYVDESTYESWLNLLKGLVMAKARASKSYYRARKPRALAAPVPHRPQARHPHHAPRARSTSPASRSYTYPPAFSQPQPQVHPQPHFEPSPAPGTKRPRPTYQFPAPAATPERPAKRPVLQIPEARAGPGTPSPLEHFARMSLSNNGSMSAAASPQTWESVPPPQRAVPQTLMAPYRVDARGPTPQPQNLYYYSLACSPLHEDDDADSRWRKARLRSYQPPVPPIHTHTHTQHTALHPPPPYALHAPQVQSASTSPLSAGVPAAPALPHFHDTLWASPVQRSPVPYDAGGGGGDEAPFANAGPPGVHFYSTPAWAPEHYAPPYAVQRHSVPYHTPHQHQHYQHQHSQFPPPNQHLHPHPHYVV